MLQAASFGPSPQLWLDLGCGSGVFTSALAELLPSGSQVIGIDKSFQYLPKSSANGVRISFVQADFSYAFKMERFDGVMMANSLHYMSEQENMIDRLALLMGSLPQFLIVEYDSDAANPWVPYPIKYAQLEYLSLNKGWRITKLGERQSIYGAKKMYAAQIQPQSSDRK